MGGEAGFVEVLEAVWVWWEAAIGASQDGSWVRDAREREVIRDVLVAADPLHGGRLPPYTGDPMAVRIGRVARWAGIARLAAGAGGWRLSPVVGTAPARPGGMAELLSALNALGEAGRRWQRDRIAGAPPAERDLAAAESFLMGPGSIEDLEGFFYD